MSYYMKQMEQLAAQRGPLPEDQPTTLHPTPNVLQEVVHSHFLAYRGPLVITSPLAAIEAAIIAHIKIRRSLPAEIFICYETFQTLEREWMQVKPIAFEGVYYHCTGAEVRAIKIKTERQLPEWSKLVLSGINRDQIYTAISSH